VDPDSSPPSRLRRFGAAARLRRSGLFVSVSDGKGRAVRDGGLGRWLARVAPRGVRGDVAIALVSDARMRTLNRTYRGGDYATDVLSFPALDDDGVGPHRPGRTADGASLGDLVIATGVARRQAREARHAWQTELRVLALHGLLHLLGYDHDAPDDNGRMKRVETRLRKKGGLKAGLIGRVEGGQRLRLQPSEKPARRRAGPADAKATAGPLRKGRDGRAATRSGAREVARAGVGPREHRK
jgi:probable rRNA maturation factor